MWAADVEGMNHRPPPVDGTHFSATKMKLFDDLVVWQLGDAFRIRLDETEPTWLWEELDVAHRRNYVRESGFSRWTNTLLAFQRGEYPASTF